MGMWHALFYPLKPGTEDKVKEIFRTSGRPDFEVKDRDGNVVGQLLATMAFVGTGMAVRAIQVEGPLPLVAGHIGRQPAVREFERQLEEHLAVPRDMTTEEGARAFFRDAALECVLQRRYDEPI